MKIKQKKNKKLLLNLILFFLSATSAVPSYSQCGGGGPALTFVNPSFEGPSQAHVVPGPWQACYGSPDTQPGQWGITLPPSDGTSYISALQSGSSATGYTEGASQPLSACMVAGQQYTFTIDLAFSPVYNTASPGDCYGSLQITGGATACAQTQILWQSGVITNTNWQTYTITFTPTGNWCYISMRPYFITPCSGYINIMIDNITPIISGSPGIIITSPTTASNQPCTFNVTGTTDSVPTSITLIGDFNGSPMNVPVTGLNWQANVVYPALFNGATTISAIAVFASGCSDTATVTFNIIDIVPGFNAADVCLGTATSFSDLSTITAGSIVAWNWDFGDGVGNSLTQNPTYTYSNPGTYTVLLVVTSNSGCTDSISANVNVFYNPIAGFTFTDVCFGNNVNFTNTSSVNMSTSISGYAWNFGDGNTSILQSPSHLYAGPGLYNVSLTVTTVDGCSNIYNASVNVIAQPVSSFTVSDVCFPASAVFNNTSSGSISSWSWNFGDGSNLNTIDQNPVHSYLNPGTYTVELINYFSGCSDTAIVNLNVFHNPSAGFNFSDVCDGNSVNFTNTSTVNMATSITNYDWDFGDGNTSTVQNPSHLYAAVGIYNVSLTITTADGCTDVFTATVNVFPVPVSSFTVNDVCLSDQAMFINTSTGPITSWEWDFGDGSPLNTTQNPSHFYPVAGNYTVTLVSFSLNCSDTVTAQIEIFPMPVADFNFTNECFGDPNVFTDMSQGNQDWAWDFGDGVGVSAVQSPTYTYANPGNYNVTLIVTTGNNCTDTITKNVLVYALPVSQFSVDDVCLIDPAIFNNTSSGISGPFSWNFGDGSPIDSTSQNPIHYYPSAGTYTVTLINNSIGGCADTAIVNVVIFPMPVANFSFNNVCLNEPMVFNDLSSGSNLSYDWDFNNDGIVDNTTASPSHIYTSPGSHLVTLTVTTPEGCIDIMQQTITVYPLPVTLFSAASVCYGTNTEFQNNSYIGPPDNIPSWQWNFDDGSPIDTAKAPVYLYNAPGTYNVELLITSNNGCQDSLTIPVTVHPNPAVSFLADDTVGCSPLCVNFQDFSSVLTGSNQDWLWDFGDGNTSNNSNPAHCYKNNTSVSHSQHTVSLTVTSNEGCSTIKVENNYITVNPLPIADFSYSPQPTTIANPLIYFQNQSFESAFWQWNFGDSIQDISNEQNPYYNYTDTGSFVVTLIAENNYGCTDTIEQTVVIGPDWMIFIPNAFTPNDDRVNDLFFAKGYGIIEFEMLIFNRWGEVIFNTKKMDEGWDGSYRGNATIAQEEVYVYLIKVLDINKKPHKYTGSVTVIR